MLWLTALVLAAGADAGTQGLRVSADTFLEVPKALSRTEVPKGLQALGIPVQLSAVLSRETLSNLEQHYRDAFRRAGLFVPEKGQIDDVGPLPQVTGLDVESQTSYSVLFQANRDGTTTVIIGRAGLHAAQEPEGPFAPVFPGGTAPLVADLEAGKTLTYSTPAPAAEVLAFYKDTLRRSGFQSTGDNAWTRGAVALQVWATPRESGTAVVVVRHERGPP
jgi:hypothetical protein